MAASATTRSSASAGKDTIDGGLGDDIIEGGDGADTLKGNTGLDTLSYSSETDSVTVTLKGAAAADVSDNTGNDAEGDVATGFENLRGGKGKDKLTGDKGNNVIEGGAGEDMLDGGGGIDTLSYATPARASSSSCPGLRVRRRCRWRQDHRLRKPDRQREERFAAGHRPRQHDRRRRRQR